MKKPSIILGIDPGIATTGFGIIEVDNQQLKLIKYGCILTKVSLPHGQRLKQIHQELTALIKKYKPQAVAVEKLFFCNNAKTALVVGEARGVVMLIICQYNLPVYEYTPLQVKQAVSAYGKADKKQVQQMVKLLLNMKEIPKPDDAADALAVAICCANSI
ncbi:MAG: crossover junction endodeoxyribonuclease RuvC [Candidatus Falkowbacteria bacterium]